MGNLCCSQRRKTEWKRNVRNGNRLVARSVGWSNVYLTGKIDKGTSAFFEIISLFTQRLVCIGLDWFDETIMGSKTLFSLHSVNGAYGFYYCHIQMDRQGFLLVSKVKTQNKREKNSKTRKKFLSWRWMIGRRQVDCLLREIHVWVLPQYIHCVRNNRKTWGTHSHMLR